MIKWLILTVALIVAPSSYANYRVRANELDPSGLLASICQVENSWRHPSPQGKGRRLPNGKWEHEIGICQVFPSTAAQFSSVSVGNLHQGARSNEVKDLQLKLKASGYDPGPVDGVFGLRTHIAVTLFQSARNLKPDGIVGNKTRAALGMSVTSLAELLEDPDINMQYAAKYLDYLREYLGTNERYILAAAYNGGPANSTVIYMLKVERASEQTNTSR